MCKIIAIYLLIILKVYLSKLPNKNITHLEQGHLPEDFNMTRSHMDKVYYMHSTLLASQAKEAYWIRNNNVKPHDYKLRVNHLLQ